MNIRALITIIKIYTGVIILNISNGFCQSGGYGIIEKHLEQLPNDVFVFNEDSVKQNLFNLIDKPSILSFVYYKCPGFCSPTMEGIVEVIDRTGLRLGKDYQVLTISIDERETPSLAKQKKGNYSRLLKNQDSADHWYFFTADKTSIKKLTDATGFAFKREGEDIVHSAAIMVLTPDARVSQYLYGTFYNPMHVKMAILDAYKGNKVPTRIKVLKYCYNFVPPENESVVLIVRAGGITIITMVLGILIYVIMHERKRKVGIKE